MTKKHYQTLGVDENATLEQIKSAYEKKMEEITEAYEILSNEELREKYDEKEKITSNARNILLLGRKGSGKSTLANGIIGSNKFTECPASTSETKDIKDD